MKRQKIKKLRIGLIHQGNDSNDIWGCSITTYHLAKCFINLGHDVWRASITYDKNKLLDVSKYPTDLLIVEGTPEWLIPEKIIASSKVKLFWWLSELYYDTLNIKTTVFDGIATNSQIGVNLLTNSRIPAKKIDLCVFGEISKSLVNKNSYSSFCTYLGNYPHKDEKQTALLFEAAINFSFTIWGNGWQNSKYKKFHAGILSFSEIGTLYRSTPVSFLLTETRQKNLGMFNNRLFEILGAGSIIISERFEALANDELGEYISFSNSKEETLDLLMQAQKNSRLKALAKRAQKHVLSLHTYENRAEQFLLFYEELL